ncbi:MAG: RNA-directed DNA polymerase [Rhodobacteraceae bacterium]|nr:RNA-directed DNA polymerase [Paracoccaceae bacterium]
MSKLAILKGATNLADVAHLLAFKPSGLSYLLYKLPDPLKYTEFDIPKRHGGSRKISAPTDSLKNLQQNLSKLLQDCLEELDEAGLRKNDSAHGFTRHRTIMTNAMEHRNRRFVFNADIKDFFPCINFGRIRGFFIKDKNFALNPAVATVIAQIACHNNALPQGSPSSPVISNLIAYVLDTHLVSLAQHTGCHYTRYVDDLTFSTNMPSFPKAIAKSVSGNAHNWAAGKSLTAIVSKSGFLLNSAKTRMQYRDSRQEVTGLVVNKTINVRREYRHKLRALTFRLINKGDFNLIHKSVDILGNITKNVIPASPAQLQGMLAFVDAVDIAQRDDAIRQLHDKHQDGQIKYERYKLVRKENTYRRFLMFNEFFATPKPIMLCEGPTDRVYIRCAVNRLAAFFPTLATINATGEVSLNFRRYKYDGSNTNRILKIHGGAAQLMGFISEYRLATEKFLAPGPFEPVIILVDNDNGPEELFKYLANVNKVKVPRMEPFIHVCANIYVVPTPLGYEGEPTCIEDLFPSHLFKEEVAGKTFNPKKKHGDNEKFYGKEVFAEKVIVQKADTINFDAFKPLLANIELAINTHRKNHPKPK